MYDSEQGIIVIDWKRLWIFSTLDATLTNKHRQNQRIAMVDMPVTRVHKPALTIKKLLKRYRRYIPEAALSPAEENYFNKIESWTESKCREIFNIFKKYPG